MKLSYLLLPLFFFTSISQAAETPAEPYEYGKDLDIAKVVSIEDPQDPFICEVITAKMTYIDSAGETKAVSYRKLSTACSMQS